MPFRDFFYLHKSDRQVLTTLLLAAAVLIGAIFLLGEMTEETETAANEQSLQDSITALPKRKTFYIGDSLTVRTKERFPFDPNTADSTQLLRLGLQPWQVRNIYKYRAAGGIYRRKEDFAQLYGLTQKEYRELEPYIRISADYQPAALLVKDEPSQPRDTVLFPRKLKEGETIDLAQADTTALKRVPGIGSYYARRIVNYGERLGGYVSVDQLDEIEDFPIDAKKYFVIQADVRRKLNLNRLSVNELKRHPYLNYYQARAIVDYRRTSGAIKSLDDLRLLPDFPAEALQKLAPYVTF